MTEHYKNLSLKDIPGEEWRDIEGFEGFYQVSNKGRVKSLEREMFVNVGNGHYRKISEKILKQDIRKNTGYSITSRVNLCEDKKQCHVMISRLVATTFFEKSINKNAIIFHKDGDALNNSVENIYWGSGDDYSNLMYNLYYKNKSSKYHGVAKVNGYYRTFFGIQKKRITKYFLTELEAAKKYDYYVKKYKLNRELNFPDDK